MDIFYEVFSGDFLCHDIDKKLSSKDVYNLIISRGDSIINDKYELYLRNLVVDKLKDVFDVNYDNFLNFLNESHGVITGSFIPSCINQEEEYSDIDIFFDKEFIPLLYDLVPKIDLKFISHEGSYFNGKSDLQNDMFDDKIYNVDTYMFKNYKIQFISVFDIISFEEYINSKFDFTVIKNYLSIKNGVISLYIKDIFSIINKILKFDNVSMYRQSRVSKYVSKGYKLSDNDNEILNSFFSEKYYKTETCNTLFDNIIDDEIDCNDICYIKRFIQTDKIHKHVLPKERVQRFRLGADKKMCDMINFSSSDTYYLNYKLSVMKEEDSDQY